MKQILGVLKEIIDAVDLVADILGIKFLKDVLKERTKRKAEINYRPMVMNVIKEVEACDPNAAAKLWRWLEKANREHWPDWENNVIFSLGDVLTYDDHDKVIMSNAVQTYRWIATFDDEQFAIFVEAMKDNRFAQRANWFLKNQGLPGIKWLFEFLFEAAKFTGQGLRDFVSGRKDKIAEFLKRPMTDEPRRHRLAELSAFLANSRGGSAWRRAKEEERQKRCRQKDEYRAQKRTHRQELHELHMEALRQQVAAGGKVNWWQRTKQRFWK